MTERLFLPRSVDEAIGVLREHGDDLTVLAGGTIVMAQINEGWLIPTRVLGLARAGLDTLDADDGRVAIGATTTLASLAQQAALPVLAQAAHAIGGPALRTMATVGGNLFAPPPSGDLGVPLLALDAEVDLAGPDGRRTLPLREFFAQRGRPRAGRELVTGLRVPRPLGQSVFVKQGRRRANAASVVSVAVHLVAGADGACREARIALGAAGPYPMRATTAEAALVGRPLSSDGIAAAADAAMGECDPFTDALASAWYRRKMVGVQVKRALQSLLSSD